MKLPELPGGDTSPRTMITVGFGDARLTRDGKTVYDGEVEQREGRIKSWDDFMTFCQAAERAAAEPVHDWRIVLEAPFWNETYQWQGRWVLVERGEGFA